MATTERIRKIKREYMRRARLIPEKRERWNRLRRENPKWGIQQKAYLNKIRETQFFRWRAKLFSQHYKSKISARDLAGLWKKQRGLCPLTGRKLSKDSAHLDHIVPITRGGIHTLSNLRWMDLEVNMAKRNLTDEEFIRLCRNVAEWIAKRIMAYKAANP